MAAPAVAAATAPGPATLGAALAAAQRLGLERLDAQLLLLHALGQPRSARAWLLAHADAALVPAAAAARYARLCQQRLDGVPLAYLVGWRAFYGLELQVDARALDPRPDTETLVDWALHCLHGLHAPTLLDLGTGSGAIALALQHARPDARVWALDASADALALAAANAQRLRLPLRLRHGHWLREWPQAQPFPPLAAPAAAPPAEPDPQRLHLIVANPPYIRAGDAHLHALRHEPRAALVAGPDGLDDLRAIIASARAHLLPGAWLLLEHGYDQAAAVAMLLQQHGYHSLEQRHDLAGQPRCSGARWGLNPNPAPAACA